MDNLSELVYCSLKEEEGITTGWSKATIDYVLSHKSKVHASIRGIAKSLGKLLPKADVEDIYSILLTYLYNSDDYNISKAYNENNKVSFDGYVHSCIKFCVIRYVTKMYKEEKKKVTENVVDDEGKEMSLFDTIADSKDQFNDFGYELDDICKLFESERYAFGTDIFMIWFIRLQTIIYNKQERYKEILEILGISKKDISDIEKKADVDGAMLSIAKAVSIIGPVKAVEILKNYTYSYKKIEKVIQLF